MTGSRGWAAILFSLALAGIGACGETHTAGVDGGQNDGSPDLDAGDLQVCADATQCVVVPASCCGTCGAATRGDAIAVNVDLADTYRSLACEDGVGCLACFMEQDPTLLGVCSEGRCTVVDLLAHPATACTDASECRVRTRDCCECGGDTTRTGLIAIPSDAEGAYTDLVCTGLADCPDCLPPYPEEATAICSADGRCRVEWTEG